MAERFQRKASLRRRNSPGPPTQRTRQGHLRTHKGPVCTRNPPLWVFTQIQCCQRNPKLPIWQGSVSELCSLRRRAGGRASEGFGRAAGGLRPDPPKSLLPVPALPEQLRGHKGGGRTDGHLGKLQAGEGRRRKHLRLPKPPGGKRARGGGHGGAAKARRSGPDEGRSPRRQPWSSRHRPPPPLSEQLWGP